MNELGITLHADQPTDKLKDVPKPDNDTDKTIDIDIDAIADMGLEEFTADSAKPEKKSDQ